jgi:hypothetical protein
MLHYARGTRLLARHKGVGTVIRPMDTITVRTDDRVRLMSALLAATSWPDDEQQRKLHGTHAHARGTRRRVQAQARHPAVLILQALLDRGLPLEEMFGYVLHLGWPGLEGDHQPEWAPPTWPRHLLNFYRHTGLDGWWEAEAVTWERAARETEAAVQAVQLRAFLRPFVGEFEDDLVLLPNLSYPTDREVGVATGDALVCILPPRMAWGDNPPWPFSDDRAYVLRAALTQYSRLLMGRILGDHAAVVTEAARHALPVSPAFAGQYPTWEARFLALVGMGLVAIYLEDHVSPAEAGAYVLLARKAQGLEALPGVVDALRRYLAGQAAGTYTGFADYLPHFLEHLRVTRKLLAP